MEASEEEFHTPLLVPDFQLSPTQLSHVTTGMKYYRRRMAIWGTDGDRNIEMTWATLRWMAYNAFFILKDFPAAEEYYLECIDFDRDRADCKTELSRLYTWSGKHELAYRWALEAVLTPMPERSFSNNFYVYDCLSLVQACRAAVNLMTDQPVILAGHALSRDSDSAPPTTTYDLRPFALGHFLGVKAADQCVDGVQLERSDILPQLAATFEAIWVQHKYKEGAGEWDKVLHVEDICVDKDRDFESQSLVQLNGEHYFCEGGGAGGGEVAGEFTYVRERSDEPRIPSRAVHLLTRALLPSHLLSLASTRREPRIPSRAVHLLTRALFPSDLLSLSLTLASLAGTRRSGRCLTTARRVWGI